jgi:hypothetical protein
MTKGFGNDRRYPWHSPKPIYQESSGRLRICERRGRRGSRVVLPSIGYVEAEGLSSADSSLDKKAESLYGSGVGTWLSLVEHCIRDASLNA